MSPNDSTITLDGKNCLRIRLGAHRGRAVIDLRYWYAPADGGPLKPTRRGITFTAGNLCEVIDGLEHLKLQMVQDGALEFTGEGRPPKFHPQVYPPDF